MALKITDECINCGACADVCPNTSIYVYGDPWNLADGTSVKGKLTLYDGQEVEANAPQEALSDEFFYIVPEKCTECKGFHEVSQCADVCPVDCCVPDPDFEESEDELLSKMEQLHGQEVQESDTLFP